MTDYKQLCADLVDELNQLSAHIEATTPFETVLSGIRAYSRARAALAAEPVAPTDEDLLRVAAKALDYERIDNVRFGAVEAYGVELVDFARAVLARWGSPNQEQIRSSLEDAPTPTRRSK